MNSLGRYPLVLLSFAVPILAFAQYTTENIIDLVGNINDILSYLILPLAAVATIIFIWGVVTYIWAAADEANREKGKQRIIYGLVGLFILVAFWGIVNILINTFGMDTSTPVLPELPS